MGIASQKMDQKQKDKEGVEHEDTHKIRITMTSRLTKPLEHDCSEIIARAKVQGYKTVGPRRLPTKCLTVTCRRSPCGNGTNTWDRYEMRIHKRVIDVYSPTSAIKEITNFRKDAAVNVNNLLVLDDDRAPAERQAQM